MIGAYLNSRGTWTPVSKDINGVITEGTPVPVDCQVVDDTDVELTPTGLTGTEGNWSVVIVPIETAIKEGDLFQVTEVRGVPVDRDQRKVSSSALPGGFTASHRELLI